MAAFSSLTDRLSNAFKHLKSKGKLSEADIDGTIREIRRALLDADVALDVVRSFTSRIRERALGTEVSEALNPAQQVVKIVNEELTAVLGAGVDRPLNFAKNPPTIIMLAGLQGAGKTTLAGKLGYWLKDSGHTPLLVAADLQRPNAVTQLQFGPFPKDTLALIVSGGHTSLLHVEDVARHIDVVGTTLDDAAGECFDKVARLLGFPYPGGPHIDRHAQLGNPHAIKVPQGLTQGKAGQQHPYDFSFSGVKTAVARWIEQQQAEGNEIPIDDVCASLADSVATVLARKAMRGCEQYGSKTLIVGGGFSANSQLRAKLLEVGAKHGVEVRIPQIKLCTDNGAMVAMLGVNLVESGVKPSEPDFAIDSAMPLTKISM